MTLQELLPNAALILTLVRHQTFVFTDEGKTYRFDVDAGNQAVARLPRAVQVISLAEAGIDREHITERYPDIDWDYARTCDLSKPLLFVPWKGEAYQLIDGWHRLAKAVMDGMDELPVYVLTGAERDAIMEEVRE